ncbi:MAG: DUF547 domain-containing protein [Synechococcales bacterium]|nr:DUF547 domain-containing protein [Synechococcales bacterium]
MRWLKQSALVLALLALSGCSSGLSFSQITLSSSETANPTQVDEAYQTDLYTDVLSRYVDASGLVNYTNLQADRTTLDQFNASLGAVTVETYEAWDEAQKIAFLVNAYNSFTLQSIIDQTPLKSSIRDISGVWRGRKWAIAQQSKTLDEIEHQILRKEFNEPRIHAALVCAAISCPPLRGEVYTADRLDAQLDDQVEQWLNGPHGLRIDREAGRVYISAIFDWFGEDWIPTYGTDTGFTGNAKERAVLNFISQYLEAGDRDYLQSGDYDLKYLDYDWALNTQP